MVVVVVMLVNMVVGVSMLVLGSLQWWSHHCVCMHPGTGSLLLSSSMMLVVVAVMSLCACVCAGAGAIAIIIVVIINASNGGGSCHVSACMWAHWWWSCHCMHTCMLVLGSLLPLLLSMSVIVVVAFTSVHAGMQVVVMSVCACMLVLGSLLLLLMPAVCVCVCRHTGGGCVTACIHVLCI